MFKSTGLRSVIIALALCLSISAVAEAKIAAAPFNLIVQESNMGKEAAKVIESKAGKESKDLEKDVAKFQKEAQDFQKQAAALSESARTKKAQELDKQMRDLDARRNALAQKVGPVQQKINETVAEVLQEATEVVAKAQNLEMIFDAAPPLFFVADSANLKDAILAEVNKIWKKRGSKFKL